ncbi:class I adenylate-forming enzyme family protein [Cumulibacter soli]|uniref:class I adenylate-forming enzyme family protein n=1 Tax=Cumulibacter soli TaxID=2546344 RepID=UPI0010685DA3|nr:fatty acid--CoA ligase family protein [Cumulibacter soli]
MTSPPDPDLVHPERTGDPVSAVLRAHRSGHRLALATSGTTGTARVVVRTTESWFCSFEAYSELSGVEHSARVWVPGPLHSTMNLFASVHARAVGAQLVDSVAQATHACLTPAQLHQFTDRLRGIRITIAGDALTSRLRQYAEERGIAVAHYYGAAELSFVAAGADATDLRPFPGAQVECRDGEIWVRSPYVAEGYQHGAGSLRADQDGFFTVGDRGSWDGNRLRVQGRADVIVTAGATVVLAEVEAVLSAVASAPLALIGVPHPRLGSVLMAVLTSSADREPLARHARAVLRASHRPRRWLVRESLPMTEAGKVDRLALRRECAQQVGA